MKNRGQLILLTIAIVLLGIDIVAPKTALAGGTKVTVTRIKPGDQVQLSGYQVLGFSCVNDQGCMILSR